MKYDYVIVGSGLFGITFARLATDAGYRCLVIEKREHIGGNCYTENIEGINVHKYGPHIFHTSSHKVWNFLNRFTEFNNFITSPKGHYKGKLYSLPFNMNTFYEIWGTKTPQEAREKIESQKFIGEPKNLEEKAISLVGKDVYETLIKGYTKKQWGRDPKELPSFIIERLPVRYIYDNNYFNDKYQGIPIGGYTKMFENMLDGIDIEINTNFFDNKEYYENISNKIVYTGCIDEFFNYKFGKLEYRSLKFETVIMDTENYQGVHAVHYADEDIPYTRIIEHKHFEKTVSDKTVITYEYPAKHEDGMIEYYPVNNKKNQEVYSEYKKEAEKLNKYLFGGRLAEYQYMDMHVVVASAMKKFEKEIER